MRLPIPALLLCLAVAPAALAQPTAPPAAPAAPAGEAPAAGAQTADPAPNPAEELSTGAPADGGPGSTYVEASFGDWEQRCVRAEDGSDPCQLYQLLKDPTGNPVAEVSIFGLPPGQQAVVGATIIVPLETLLPQGLSFQVGTAAAKKYPFAWCSPIGCVSRIGFLAEEVAALKAGSTAKVIVVPAVAPDKRVEATMSLKGFTAGLDAVNKANGL